MSKPPKDARRAIDALVNDFGWTCEDGKGGGKGHLVQVLYCTERSREGCQIAVYGSGNGTSNALWQHAKRCTHGCRPDRNKP